MNARPSSAADTPVTRHPWWQPWAAIALFAFLLHFMWELLQAPFYAGMPQAGHWAAVLRCTRATVGDVGIAELAYGTGVWLARDRYWLGSPHRAVPFAAYLGVGLTVTVVLEWWNMHVRGSWAYSSAMPVFLGVGVSPLIQ